MYHRNQFHSCTIAKHYLKLSFSFFFLFVRLPGFSANSPSADSPKRTYNYPHSTDLHHYSTLRYDILKSFSYTIKNDFPNCLIYSRWARGGSNYSYIIGRVPGFYRQDNSTLNMITQLAFLCQVTGPAKQIPPRLSFQSGIVPTRPRLTAYSGLFNKQTGIFSHLFTIFAIDGDQRASSCSGASWIGLSPIEDLVLLWRFPRDRGVFSLSWSHQECGERWIFNQR